MTLTTIIGIGFAVILLFVVLCYAFVGIISFPFYVLGLYGRILLFPITLINTYIYPVGFLPYIVLFGFWAFLLYKLVSSVFKTMGYKK